MNLDLTDEERAHARSQFAAMTLPEGINGEDFREMMADMMEAAAAIGKTIAATTVTKDRKTRERQFAHVERVAINFANRLYRNMKATE